MDLNKFKLPDNTYAQTPFWAWNDKLDKDELKRQVDEIADKGWGGYFIHSRLGLVTEYLSDEWMDCVRVCIEEAKKKNIKTWLYDEDMWPSGFAAGEVAFKDREFRNRYLELRTERQESENEIVLTEYIHNGVTYYITDVTSPLGSPWFNRATYVDLMNEDVTDTFIESTHEKYKKYFADEFGKNIPGIFTDEPCYAMINFPSIAVPWSKRFNEYFEGRKGYSILPHLSSLFFQEGDYKRIRYDFYETATKMFVENYTLRYYKWCEDNNMIFTGHYMSENTFAGQTEWIGSAMSHYEFMHWPGIDKLGRQLEQAVTVKQLSSVVEQLDKERAFCEAFGTVGNQCSFYHRKWISEWLCMLGVDFINTCMSEYSMRGDRKRDFPINFFYQQPWWKDEKNFSDYVARMCYATSQGKRDIDVLIIHTIGSEWAERSPMMYDENNPKGKSVFDSEFDAFANDMLNVNLDYHFGDEFIFENNAKVEDGKFVVGKYSYSTVVVPPAVTLKKSTVELITEFIKAGGTLVMYGVFPSRQDGIETKIDFNGDNVYRLFNRGDAIKVLDNLYLDRIKITDKLNGNNASYIVCEQRIDGENENVYLLNTKEEKEVDAVIEVCSDKTPYVMDFNDGEIYKIPFERKDNKVIIDVKLYGAGSMFVAFSNDILSDRELDKFCDMGFVFAEKIKTIEKIEPHNITALESNVILLDKVTLKVDGVEKYTDHPIFDVWNNCFYRLEEGTPFEVEYKFNVVDVPGGEVFAVIEIAENLDSISLNGKAVKAAKQKGELGAYDENKSWRDINFTKVDITGCINSGVNSLVIKGAKCNNIFESNCHLPLEDSVNHEATEIENIYIIGDFNVDLVDGKDQFIVKSKGPEKNITDSGYPFYIGDIEYSFDVKKASGKYLRIDKVDAANIKLYINGELQGVKYWKPYIYNISDKLNRDVNDVKVVITNTMVNVMGPNNMVDIFDARLLTPKHFLDSSKFTEEYQLKRVGIEGVSICDLI